MKILVTGSEGSIGQFVVKKLYELYSDIQVIRIGRTRHKKTDGKSIYYWGDLTDPVFCKKIFSEQNISHVISCAAHWNGINQNPEIFDNNFNSISNLLSIVSKNVESFIFISSSAVYENAAPRDDIPVEANPKSTYGDAKLKGEQLVKTTAKEKGFSYTIYRPFHVVSPKESFKPGSSHVCTDFCYRMIEKGEHFDLHGFGHERGIGFMWVEDMASIIVSNLFNSKTSNETFNIGTDEQHTIRELANEIIHVAHPLGLVEQQAESVEPFITVSPYPNFDKLRQASKPYTQTTFSECIKKFITFKYKKALSDEI